MGKVRVAGFRVLGGSCALEPPAKFLRPYSCRLNVLGVRVFLEFGRQEILESWLLLWGLP